MGFGPGWGRGSLSQERNFSWRGEKEGVSRGGVTKQSSKKKTKLGNHLQTTRKQQFVVSNKKHPNSDHHWQVRRNTSTMDIHLFSTSATHQTLNPLFVSHEHCLYSSFSGNLNTGGNRGKTESYHIFIMLVKNPSFTRSVGYIFFFYRS